MAFTLIACTKTWESPDGSTPTGTVVFTLSSEMTDPTTGESVATDPITATLSGGAISQNLVANNDTTTTPAGTYYNVVETVGGVSDSYRILVPHNAAGGTVKISSIVF